MAETNPRSVAVTVRYFAAARAGAGVDEETLAIPAVGGAPGGQAAGPRRGTVAHARGATAADARNDAEADPATSVGAVVATIAERHAELTRVLPRCSFLLDEVAVHGTATLVRDGQVLDVLPPFAGG